MAINNCGLAGGAKTTLEHRLANCLQKLGLHIIIQWWCRIQN
jgi:hypothetical protein